MKVIVDSATLSKELKKISPVMMKNTIFPILEGIKFDVVGNVLKLTATDLNTTISTELECTSKKDDTIVIPFYDLHEICSRSTGPLQIDVKEKIIQIVSDKATYKLSNGFHPKDFPSVENVEYYNEVDVDGDFFFALSGANSVKASDGAMTQMNNIGLDYKKDKLVVVGLNQMSVYKREFAAKNKKETVVSVVGKFADLTKLFQETKLSISEKFIKAESGTTMVISRLSEVLFIKYEVAFTNVTKDFNVTFNRKDLIDSITIVGIAASAKTKAIVLTFSEGKIDLKSVDIDNGREAETVMNIQHSVDEMSISLNGASLINLLNTMEVEEVNIFFNTPKSAVVIMPSSEEKTILLVMPQMI